MPTEFTDDNGQKKWKSMNYDKIVADSKEEVELIHELFEKEASGNWDEVTKYTYVDGQLKFEVGYGASDAVGFLAGADFSFDIPKLLEERKSKA